MTAFIKNILLKNINKEVYKEFTHLRIELDMSVSTAFSCMVVLFSKAYRNGDLEKYTDKNGIEYDENGIEHDKAS